LSIKQITQIQSEQIITLEIQLQKAQDALFTANSDLKRKTDELEKSVSAAETAQESLKVANALVRELKDKATTMENTMSDLRLDQTIGRRERE
jgi:SMC interacting uncharacterized protein involved in chromosome segregation